MSSTTAHSKTNEELGKNNFPLATVGVYKIILDRDGKSIMSVPKEETGQGNIPKEGEEITCPAAESEMLRNNEGKRVVIISKKDGIVLRDTQQPFTEGDIEALLKGGYFDKYPQLKERLSSQELKWLALHERSKEVDQGK